MSQTKIKAGGFDVDVITGTTALAEAPASTDEFLISDGGVLKRLDASYIGGTNTPAFHVYLSGDQTIGTGAATKVAFDSEYYDTDSAFASNKFTVPSGEGGTYNFQAIIKTQSVNNNTALQVFLYKNNSELDSQQSRHKDYMSTSSSEELHVSFSYTDVASATDYYELYVFHNNGNNRTLKAETSSFWGYKLIT